MPLRDWGRIAWQPLGVVSLEAMSDHHPPHERPDEDIELRESVVEVATLAITSAGAAATVGGVAYNIASGRRQQAREIAREEREARQEAREVALLDAVLRRADNYDPGFSEPVQLGVDGDDTPRDLGVGDDDWGF